MPILPTTAQNILSGKIKEIQDVKYDDAGGITILYTWNPKEKIGIIETFFVKQ